MSFFDTCYGVVRQNPLSKQEGRWTHPCSLHNSVCASHRRPAKRCSDVIKVMKRETAINPALGLATVCTPYRARL